MESQYYYLFQTRGITEVDDADIDPANVPIYQSDTANYTSEAPTYASDALIYSSDPSSSPHDAGAMIMVNCTTVCILLLVIHYRY